jgi:CP family cyanate transporter-like MFS transporter
MGLLVVSLILAAVNLRPAVTSVPPILPEIGSQFGINGGWQTCLVSLPLLCFGLVALVALRLVPIYGEEQIVFGALVLVLVGLLARAAGAPGVFAGTLVACSGIAALNVVFSSLIKRRAPERAGLMVGLYLLMLYLGAMAGSGLSVPFLRWEGGSASWALASWAALAVVGLAAWAPQLRARPAQRGGVGAGRGPRVAPGTWLLAGFMATQNVVYYATVSFLPALFRARGATPAHAGFLVSATSLGGLATALGVPVAVHRYGRNRAVVVPTAVATALGVVGALIAPLSWEALCMIVLGAAEGSALGLAISMTVSQAESPSASARLSGASQSVGYLVAAVGLFLTGLLHEATRSWALPVVALVALSMAELAFGWAAVRPARAP